MAPRIAGLSQEYLVKVIKEYREGEVRSYPLMNKTSGIDRMSEADIEDISAYLASIDLSPDSRFNISSIEGDPSSGKKLTVLSAKYVMHQMDTESPRKRLPHLQANRVPIC